MSNVAYTVMELEDKTSRHGNMQVWIYLDYNDHDAWKAYTMFGGKEVGKSHYSMDESRAWSLYLDLIAEHHGLGYRKIHETNPAPEPAEHTSNPNWARFG